MGLFGGLLGANIEVPDNAANIDVFKHLLALRTADGGFLKQSEYVPENMSKVTGFVIGHGGYGSKKGSEEIKIDNIKSFEVLTDFKGNLEGIANLFKYPGAAKVTIQTANKTYKFEALADSCSGNEIASIMQDSSISDEDKMTKIETISCLHLLSLLVESKNV